MAQQAAAGPFNHLIDLLEAVGTAVVRIGDLGTRASFGHHTVGQELDAILNWNATKWLSLQGGYAHLWGGPVLKANRDFGPLTTKNVQFAYLQMTLKY